MNATLRTVTFISRYILIAVLAFVIGIAATVYTIHQPIDFKVGITVVTDEANAPWQFYCHANSHYSGEFSSEGYYSQDYEIEPNTYRIKIPIVCGNGATHLRFDPLPDAGEVTITNITKGQIFTPILAVAHARGASLFELGMPASNELEQLAERAYTVFRWCVTDEFLRAYGGSL